MKHTVSVSKKIYVGDRLLGEIFYSREFDDSLTPPDISFQNVSEQVDKWADELSKKWTAQPTSQKAQPKPEVRTVEDVARVFPRDLASLLSFRDAGEIIIAKPKRYLGMENFRRIATIVRDLGGEYVSAGKESEWRIPKSPSDAAASEMKIGFIDETAEIPDFNPLDLMEHEGWKGRKKADGSYDPGSLEWGWDFADQFPESVIQALKKGPFEIDRYVFSLNPSGNLVQTRKKRKEEV